MKKCLFFVVCLIAGACKPATFVSIRSQPVVPEVTTPVIEVPPTVTTPTAPVPPKENPTEVTVIVPVTVVLPPFEPKTPKPIDPPKGEVCKDPFVEITKLGINFEDIPKTDEDYNDAVLCFAGAFQVNNSHVVSSINQEINASVSSIALCKHKIEVKIFDPSKKLVSSTSYDTKTTKDIRLKLSKGDELEVNMRPYEGANCGVGEVRSMYDSRFAKVLRNQCNTTGR